MNKLLLAGLLTVTSVSVSALDTVAISLKDVTPAAHEVLFGGKIDFSEHTDGKKRAHREQGAVVGHNVSTKNIIALVATIKYAGFRGPGTTMLYRHDFFFKQHGLEAGESFEIPIKRDGGEEPFNIITIDSYATAELQFVQFDDGSTWGDKNAAEALFAQRLDTEAYLNRLLAAYKQRGPSAFPSALEQDQPIANTSAFAVCQRLLLIYRQFGAAATADNVKTRLKLAADRRATGKF